MRDFLFATPWWVFIGLGVLAMSLLIAGNNRQNSQLKMSGLSVLFVGIAIFAISWIVETPVEIARRQTREMLTAIVNRQSEPLEQILHTNASLVKWGKPDIVYGAKMYADQYGIKSTTVTGMEAREEAGGYVQVDLAVLATFESSKAPIDTIMSYWQFLYMETNNGWRLKEIIPKGIGQMQSQEVGSRFFTGKVQP